MRVARKLYLSEAHKEADQLLMEMAGYKCRLKAIQDRAEAEIAKIRGKYVAEIKDLESIIQALDKKIKTLCKYEREELFAETQRVELQHGALLYHAEWKIKRARGVLDKLEELGMTEAIKVSKSVRWDVLEKWTDEKLFLVGTERKLKESFSYELYE